MLWREERIQKLLKNRKEFVELVGYKRKEDKYVFNKAYEQDINIVKKVLSELKDKIKSLE